MRRAPERLARLLADDFVEYGTSGVVYTKADVLRQVPGDDWPQFRLDAFEVSVLAPEVVLARYRLTERDFDSDGVRVAIRSSIWQRRDERWVMVFHQGTVVSGT